MARRRMKRKRPELKRALTGRLTPSQRWVLRELLDHYEQVEAAITRVEEKIGEEIEDAPDPFVGEAVKLWDTRPGIAEGVAQTIVSEIGVEMTRFSTARNLASWGGMCPGHNESAGKRKTGKMRTGNRYLRAALVEAAWAASHQKATYLSAQYKRLVKRMGKKKALIAVGHSILVIVYHVLANRVSYQELGGDYFDGRDQKKRQLRLIRQLESLGLKVTVEETAQAA